MILVENGRLVIDTYIMEVYRRLYDVSVRYDMTVTPFLVFLLYEDMDGQGRINVPFEDYYCPPDVFHNILVDVLSDPYVLKNGHAEHKLKKREAERVRTSVMLGCSPTTSYDGIVYNKPCSEDFIKTFKIYSEKYNKPFRRGNV